MILLRHENVNKHDVVLDEHFILTARIRNRDSADVQKHVLQIVLHLSDYRSTTRFEDASFLAMETMFNHSVVFVTMVAELCLQHIQKNTID